MTAADELRSFFEDHPVPCATILCRSGPQQHGLPSKNHRGVSRGLSRCSVLTERPVETSRCWPRRGTPFDRSIDVHFHAYRCRTRNEDCCCSMGSPCQTIDGVTFGPFGLQIRSRRCCSGRYRRSRLQVHGIGLTFFVRTYLPQKRKRFRLAFETDSYPAP